MKPSRYHRRYACQSLRPHFAPATNFDVNDVMAGDYYPWQPGQATLMAYTYKPELKGSYASSRKPFDDRIHSAVLALRVARGFWINRCGETRFGGDDQRNATNNEYVMTGMAWFLLRYQKGF